MGQIRMRSRLSTLQGQLNWIGKMLSIMNHDIRLSLRYFPNPLLVVEAAITRYLTLGGQDWLQVTFLLAKFVPGRLRDLGAKRDFNCNRAPIQSPCRRCRVRDDYDLLPYPVVQYHHPLRRSERERRTGAE